MICSEFAREDRVISPAPPNHHDQSSTLPSEELLSETRETMAASLVFNISLARNIFGARQYIFRRTGTYMQSSPDSDARGPAQLGRYFIIIEI
jgi:hypothetical protein